MFPLPGAPRQQVMDPSRLASLMNQQSGSASNSALKPANARQSRRLFVQNLPPSATDEDIVNFFNLHLNGLNVIESSDPCVSSQIAKDGAYALVEFKAATEATVALALDGTHMEDPAMSNGDANGAAGGLVVRRPKDYIVSAVAEDEGYVEGQISSTVPDTVNKIGIANILPNLDEEQVRELLTSFGPLKSFVLVRDRSTEESRVGLRPSPPPPPTPPSDPSKGIAFCEYVDSAATDVAVQGLNGMELGDRNLRVQRASIGLAQAAGLEMSVNAMSMLAGTTSNDLEEGRVLQLLNMVTAEELMDNEDYQGTFFTHFTIFCFFIFFFLFYVFPRWFPS
jgi:splicing factor U2AF 65 kDa subunit